MSNLEKQISLLDEPKRLGINYTCMTDMLNIKFVLADFELAAGDAARLYIRLPDGTLKYTSATKNLSANSLDFDIPANTFPVSGESRGQIRIARGTKKLYSNPMKLNIHRFYGGT